MVGTKAGRVVTTMEDMQVACRVEAEIEVGCEAMH
jgi:hypothetical protein